MTDGLRSAVRRDRPDAPAGVAALEAENAALRRALARAGLDAGRAAGWHGCELAEERAGREADAAGARSAALDAEARHGREAAAGRADLAASEEANGALRRANAELAAGRAALRGAEARQTFLLRLGDALRPLHDPEEMQAEACRLLGLHLGAAQVGFGQVDERQERVAVRRDWNDGRLPSVVGTWRMDDFGPAFAADLRRGATAAIPDIALDPRTDAPGVAAAYAGIGTRAVLDVPLVKGGRMAAMLFVHHPEPRPWSPADVEVAEETCERLWAAVERAHAEAALRASESSFRALARASSDVFYRMSPDWAEMRQLSGGGFIADAPGPTRGWLESYIHPEDRPFVRAAIADAIRTKGVFELEHRVRRPDGSLGWTLSRAVPMLGADGGIVEWFGAASDVTARRGAEESLREGEARWRGLFERMHEGLALCEMVYGPDGKAVDYRHLELNAAWGRLTGIPSEAALGRLVSAAIPGLDPFWLETYARVVETGEPAHVEQFVPALGRWYEVRAYRTGLGRFAALFTDVTERKRAEARQAALVELGDRLRDLRDPAEIARTAAEVIGRALGAARAGYGTVDAAEETVRIEREWTGDSAAKVAGAHRLSDYWTGFADALRRGEVIVTGDVARDPRTARHAARFAAVGVRACVHAPVVEAGRVAAVLFVHDAAPRDWSAEEVAFVRGAADRAWAAAERARAEAALRESERRLRATQDNAGVGITEIDDRGRYARVNGTYTRMTGRAAADLVGRAYWDLIEDDGGRRDASRDFGRLVRGEVDRLAALREYTDGHGRRWWAEITATAIRGAPDTAHPRGRFLYAVRTVQDVTERKRAEERRALLVNEVNHRAKNALAVVQAMLRLTKAADVPAFVCTVEGRVAALARAHTLLANQQWSGSSLHDLVRGELAPFLAGRATIDGPAVTLPAVAAQPVAMAIHELATNAAKHGALSAAAGTVAVAWRVEGRDLRIRWTERGGPPVGGAPKRSGFGSRLLDGTIRKQLRGTVERTWDASGLACDVVVPLGEAHGDR